MIGKLTGIYEAQLINGVIVDVAGVGYSLEVPLSVFHQLPDLGSPVSLWVHTYVKEDALKLYGFLGFEERAAFELLISLSGVGPKLALAVLSTVSVKALKRAVEGDRRETLQAVPGIGARVAERIIMELRPKLKKLSIPKTLRCQSSGQEVLPGAELGILEADSDIVQDEVFHDLQSALENLGFKDAKIGPMLRNMRQEASMNSGFPELMKVALRKLSGGGRSGVPSSGQLDKLF